MDSTHLSLIDEIRLSLSNDRWNEFFQRYDELLSRWLSGQNIQPADAEEIKQKVMVVVIKELPNFQHNGNVGAFRNWLRRIMANRLREHWKQTKARRKELIFEEIADQLMNRRSSLSADWEREHNEFLLQSLMKRARTRFGNQRVDMFEKVTLRNLPADKVAEEYKVTLGSLRVSQHRILQQLKLYGDGILF